MTKIANVLSIAGTDPVGAAGIQADLKTFSALGAYGTAIVTAVVAQNTQGVRSVTALDPAVVRDQIDAVFDDVAVDAVKIGMVATAAIAETIATRLHHYGVTKIVLDPVLATTSGTRLLEHEALRAMRDILVPIATVVTPNLPEAAALLGIEPIWSRKEMRARVVDLLALGPRWVVLKGGHLEGTSESVDILYGGGDVVEFCAPRIATRNGRGTGCTLSSAIAALLPRLSVEDSVRAAKDFLGRALAQSDALDVGHGSGPLHHFHALWEGREWP